MLVRQSVALIGLLGFAALTGCGGGSVDAGDVLVVAEVQITPPDLSLVSGSTRQLQATAKTSSGIAVPNRRVDWSSDDPGIASVSTAGVVTAVESGSTLVHATVDGVHAGITVAVSPKPVASVTVVPSQVPLLVGETVDLIATPRDQNSQPLPGRPIEFSSDNPLIATVSGAGHVVAVAPGLTVVRATSEGRVGTANIAVSARPASQLDFQSEPVTGAAGVPLPAIRIEIQNDQGGTVTSGNVPVTIALGDNPAGAVLGGTKTVNAFNGVATFSDLTVNQAGTGYTLVATSGSLTPAESAPFAIVAGSATALSISTQPSATGSSGIPLARQPVIQVRDAAGNAVAKSGVQVTAVLEGSGATLGGTRTVATNGDGIATFTNLAVTGSVGAYTLLFAAPSLTAVASSPVTLVAGSPTTLVIVQQPAATAQSGVVLTRQPVIQVRDVDGNAVPQSNLAVSATIQSGGGSLGGTTSVLTDANGRATFTNLSIAGLVGTRTLRFASGSLTGVTSENVIVSAGPAARLVLTTNPPPGAASGAVLSPGPRVQTVDAQGNTVDPDPEITVTATLSSGPGALSGTASLSTTGGAATFTNLVLTGSSGSYVLSFGGGGLAPVLSPPISIGAGAPASIAIHTQPSTTAQAGSVFAQQPVVQLRDASNNPAPVSGISVSVAIQSGGGTLNGTTSAVTNASGQAAFADLSILGTPGPRTLRFTSGALTGVTSNAIDITQPPPARIEITTQPSASTRTGLPLAQAPVVLVTDVNGTGVPGAMVTATISTGPAGGSLGNATAVTDAAGSAVFTGLSITGDHGDYTLQFEAGGVTAVSSVVTVLPEATRLLLATPPSTTATVGSPLTTQPAVQLADDDGAAVALAGVQITAVIATGPSGGSLKNASATTNAAGLAHFDDLEISGLVGSYTLRFESTGLTPVTSGAITLAAGPPALITLQTEPPLTAANDAQFSTSPVVRVQDASGNNLSGIVITASLASGPGILKGTLSRTTGSNGRATFNDLELVGTVGEYTIGFTIGGGLSVVSRVITLTPGDPKVLVIQVQPSSEARSGVVFAVQPKIELRDTGGNLVIKDGVKVSAAIVSGIGTLGGDTQVESNDGVASFTDLRITGTGTFRLRFTSNGLSSVTSVAIAVTLL